MGLFRKNQPTSGQPQKKPTTFTKVVGTGIKSAPAIASGASSAYAVHKGRKILKGISDTANQYEKSAGLPKHSLLKGVGSAAVASGVGGDPTVAFHAEMQGHKQGLLPHARANVHAKSQLASQTLGKTAGHAAAAFETNRLAQDPENLHPIQKAKKIGEKTGGKQGVIQRKLIRKKQNFLGASKPKTKPSGLKPFKSNTGGEVRFRNKMKGTRKMGYRPLGKGSSRGLARKRLRATQMGKDTGIPQKTLKNLPMKLG